MNCRRVVGAAVVVLGVASSGAAQGPPAETAATAAAPAQECPACRETLTRHWFGAGDRLAERGLSLCLTATQVYQGVARGGLATHRHAGRYAGSYDLEIEVDTEKAAGLKGGSLYLLVEGGWSDGLDASSVGSLFGANADALGDRSITVPEFWYEHSFLDGKVRLRAGKIDLTGGFECRGCPVAFDGNRLANDETSQFLNGALVNNPTIPFPDRGIGAVVYVQPSDRWYAAAGIGDAQADARETGFNTAFRRQDYFVSLFETGYIAELPSANGPMPGGYRIGLWYDPQPKARYDGGDPKRDDTGLYLSLDQVVLREKKEPEDGQGLALFARLGLADRKVNPVRFFWSVGCEYRGLLPGRDADVVGIGMARGLLSDEAGAGFTARHETVLEAYCRIPVAPGLEVSPHVQFIAHPGGLAETKDAVILGVRVLAAF